ncbi:MAG: hypothetical protein ACREX8_08265 [Gammaproteobacteria bacterium]
MLTDYEDAVALGGDSFQALELARARDGRLLAIVTLAATGLPGRYPTASTGPISTPTDPERAAMTGGRRLTSSSLAETSSTLRS